MSDKHKRSPNFIPAKPPDPASFPPLPLPTQGAIPTPPASEVTSTGRVEAGFDTAMAGDDSHRDLTGGSNLSPPTVADFRPISDNARAAGVIPNDECGVPVEHKVVGSGSKKWGVRLANFAPLVVEAEDEQGAIAAYFAECQILHSELTPLVTEWSPMQARPTPEEIDEEVARIAKKKHDEAFE